MPTSPLLAFVRTFHDVADALGCQFQGGDCTVTGVSKSKSDGGCVVVLKQDLTEATQLLRAASQLGAMAAVEVKAAIRDAAMADEAARGACAVAAEASWLVRRATSALEREQALGPPAPSFATALAAALNQEAQAIAAYVAAFEAAAEAHQAARVARVEATQSSLDVRRAQAKVGNILNARAEKRRSNSWRG
jgi:hypothetical protein